jgi:hypothetical protein
MNDLVHTPERDRERLIALVSEFAEKLRSACERYWAERLKWNNWLAIAGVSVCGLATTALWSFIFPDAWIHREIPPGPAAFMSIAGLFGFVFLWNVSAFSRKRSRFGITPIISALERLISRAAFLEDHASENEDERLIIALRIAEGEAALEYAAWVLGDRADAISSGSPVLVNRYRSQVTSL